MTEYHYTPSQFEKMKVLAEHYQDGDIIIIKNRLTGVTDKYVVETKKVFTRQKRWDET